MTKLAPVLIVLALLGAQTQSAFAGSNPQNYMAGWFDGVNAVDRISKRYATRLYRLEIDYALIVQRLHLLLSIIVRLT